MNTDDMNDRRANIRSCPNCYRKVEVPPRGIGMCRNIEDGKHDTSLFPLPAWEK